MKIIPVSLRVLPTVLPRMEDMDQIVSIATGLNLLAIVIFDY